MTIIYFERYPQPARKRHVYFASTVDDLARFPYVNWQSAKRIDIGLPCVKQYTFQKCTDLHKDRQTLYFTVAFFRHDYF